MGGEGTPLVLGHCPSELGAVLETTYTGARHLIADALDLRDRLPRLWKTVQTGGVAAWKARRVAAATRTLTIAQAAEVDAVVHEVIASLGWSRFEAILDATIKQADPDGARAAEQDAATRRFVAVGRANDHHIRTLIARGTSLDILSFMAAVNRIAELLGDEGDPDPLDIRRSKAIGILARPAYALELLARHQPEDSAEAADHDGDPDPERDGHLSSPADSPRRRDGHRCGCAPRIRLHVHLTDAALRGADPRAVCRIEGLGPVTAQTVRDWLGRSDASVTVQPVVLPDPPPVDGYEIPQAIRDALAARQPASVLPLVAERRTGRRPGPHHRLRPTREGRPARSDGCRHAGPAGPTGAPAQDVRTPQGPAAGPGGLLLAQPARLGLAGHQHRHPLPRPRPTSRRLLAAAAPRAEPPPPKRPRSPKAERRPRYRIDIIRPSAKAQIILRT